MRVSAPARARLARSRWMVAREASVASRMSVMVRNSRCASSSMMRWWRTDGSICVDMASRDRVQLIAGVRRDGRTEVDLAAVDGEAVAVEAADRGRGVEVAAEVFELGG